MLTLLVLGMIGLAVAAAVGYAVISTMVAAETLSSLRENASRMELLADVVSAELRDIAGDGRAYPPAGDTLPAGSGGYTTVPAWIAGSRSTPRGRPYVYCPLAPWNDVGTTSGTAGTVTDTDGSTYVTKTVTWTGTEQYVKASTDVASLGGAGIVAVILSDLPDSAIMPRCSQVSYNGGRLTVPGGVVRAVFADQTGRASVSREFVRFASASGTGSGLNASDRMSLQDAVSMWKATKPSKMTISLTAGAYSITSAAFDLGTGEGELILKGDGKGTTTVTASGGTFALAVPPKTRIEGVRLEGIGVVADPGDHLYLTASDVDSVTANGADVVIGNGTDLTPPSGSVAAVANGGRLTITGTVTATSSQANTIASVGGQVELVNANLTVTASPSVADTVSAIASDGHRVILTASTLNANAGSSRLKSAIDIRAGEAFLNGSTVNTAAFYGVSVSGGTLVMNNGSVGNATTRPVYGVGDLGAFAMAGSGTSVYASNANTCFAGKATVAAGGVVLNRTAPKAGSATSIPVAPVPVTGVASTEKTVLTNLSGATTNVDDITAVTTAANDASQPARVVPLDLLNRTNWSCN